MPKFRIISKNGHSIKNAIDGAKFVIHWVVQVFNFSSNCWVFVQSFYTKERAQNYVSTLKEAIEKGDYSCLTLKT